MREGMRGRILLFRLNNGEYLSQLLSDLCECELLGPSFRNHHDVADWGDECLMGTKELSQ